MDSNGDIAAAACGRCRKTCITSIMRLPGYDKTVEDERPDRLAGRWSLAVVHFPESQALQELKQRVDPT
jgi:hypothetical protein